MIKINSFYNLSFIGAVLVVSMVHLSRPHPQSSVKRNSGDTNAFAANTSGGWGTISSYLNQDTPDSVEFEVLLTRNDFTNWSDDHFIGTITNHQFIPSANQAQTYYLYVNNVWNVQVDTSGKCYLFQVSGGNLFRSALPGNPYLLPVKVRYKND